MRELQYVINALNIRSLVPVVPVCTNLPVQTPLHIVTATNTTLYVCQFS